MVVVVEEEEEKEEELVVLRNLLSGFGHGSGIGPIASKTLESFSATTTSPMYIYFYF